MLEDFAVFMQHNGIIGVRDKPGFGVDPVDRLVHPMQGDQRQQGRNTAALGRAGLGGKNLVLFQDSRFKPGSELPANRRGDLCFGY